MHIRKINIRSVLLCSTVCITGLYASQRSVKPAPLRTKPPYTTVSQHGKLCFPRRPSPRENFLGMIWRDVVDLNRYVIFSFDTIKVILASFPFYGAARLFDERIQKTFHNDCCHRDKNQVPTWCRNLSQYGLGIPIATIGLMSIFGGNQELKTTGRIFLIGMPFVIFGKDIIKKFNFDANLRPWCDRFPCDKRALGGFPSGHMAEVTYMTVLYGLRYGVKAAVPLGIFSTFLGVTFLNCNRHYISQLVAGAALGTIFALAADKVIDMRLEEAYNAEFSYAFDVNSNGAPSLKLSCIF